MFPQDQEHSLEKEMATHYSMSPPLWKKAKKNWRAFWWKRTVKKIMASSPIILWQIDGKTMETVTDFILGGSKIAADGDCSQDIKRHLLLGRKAMTNLDSILKNRDITLPTKVCLVKAMAFPVVMYGCENGIIKKAEHRRTDAFELWCWRRLLRVPWTARRSNQSTLNIHWKDWCWSWNSNTLATWCEEATHLKRPWCWERLRAGGEGDDREWDGWMVSPRRWTWVWVGFRSWWWTGRPVVLLSMESQRVKHDWATELNWLTPVFLPGEFYGERILVDYSPGISESDTLNEWLTLSLFTCT